MISLRKVTMRGLSVGARMSCWSGLYPVGLIIYLDLRNTLRYE
jgi:hypothetical protein